MENLIKLHKSQLKSDRTSCRSPLANPRHSTCFALMRLILHAAAYWPMLGVRDAIARTDPLAVAEFETIREPLLKIRVRVVGTAAKVRLAFASAGP